MDIVETKGFRLLPPFSDRCRICASDHMPEEPHDAGSLFYATRFRIRYGRPGTWADAVAHCPDAVRACVVPLLAQKGVWSEPAQGVEPIPEPIDG